MTLEEIKKELSNYSMEELENFDIEYPCENPIHELKVLCNDFAKETEQIISKLKISVVADEIINEYISDYIFYIAYEGTEDLQRRWNRYQKLKVFK